MTKTFVKYIALYLPQFHTFKENDEWWGKGFTEWTNTKPAVPFFEGHYQPHEPHDDIGYYDLSDVNVMIKQAQMAKKYNIYGFSYYYYWFNGKKLMEKPLENMLKNPQVDIPFCLFWANHNWTRGWDGKNHEILLEQTYDKGTNKRFIDDLIPYFNDKRYIRIDNKPILLVYQADEIPNPKETVNEWRKYAKEKYNTELYLISIQQNNTINPEKYGYDAAMEPKPNSISVKSVMTENIPKVADDVKITFYDYLTDIFISLLRKPVKYKLFNCVYPMWDNTPRRKKNKSWMFLGATPEIFRLFLIEMTKRTVRKFSEKERFLFINAWNEWAEGTHIEPDKKYGYKFLEICQEVGNTDYEVLEKQGFDPELYEQMKKKLNSVKLFSKERNGKTRIYKILNIPVFAYNK